VKVAGTDLATRVLRADPRILRVIIIGPEGKFLASVDSPRFGGKRASGDELERRSVAFSVSFGAAEGATKYFGVPQYLVFAFEGYKALLMRAPFDGGLINVRIPRTVNAEHVFNKVSANLKGAASSTHHQRP
jgi:hypothetical protein